MFQILRNGERLHDFVRELLTENAAKLFAKGVTSSVAEGTLEIHSHKLETIWFATAKTLHGQYQALLRVIGDGQNPASKVVFGRPKMKRWLLRSAAHFPR
jgi:hypothetical protein